MKVRAMPKAGKNRVPKAERMPITRAPTNAPFKLPSPPITATMNASMMIVSPMPGVSNPTKGTASPPPRAPSQVPKTNTPVKRAGTRTPRLAAISRSEEDARMIRPYHVFSSRAHRRSATAGPTAMMNRL